MSVTARDLEIMAWLAERDMEAVAHAHAQFLAATEPAAVADLGRTYQRVSRCLRSTLALKMKAAQAEATDAALAQITGRRAAFEREERIAARTGQLQDAVERVAAAHIPDPHAREARMIDFDMALDDWIEEPDYTTADLDQQVLRACRQLDLPEAFGRVWRQFPRPTVYPEDLADPDPAPPDAADPPAPHRDSG